MTEAMVLPAEELINDDKPNKFISDQRNDALKLVAMITMFIDHLGHMGVIGLIIGKLSEKGVMVVFNWYKLSRTIGRVAFPIFAYQVALGYSKTSNLKNYIKRLFIFAIISEIPYVLFSSDFSIHPFHFNVIFMLLVGVFVIMFFEKAKDLLKKQGVLSKVLGVVLLVVIIAIILFPQFATAYINTNLSPATNEPAFTIGKIDFMIRYDFAFSYGSYGILMVLFFHVFKGKPLRMVIGYIFLSLFDVWFTLANGIYMNGLGWFGEQFTYAKSYLAMDQFKFLSEWQDGYKKLDVFWFQERSILSLPFIIFFERFHFKIKLNKFVGYWFYPLHIALIWSAAFIMTQVF